MNPIQTTILSNKKIATTSWLLRLERKSFDFRSGELITLYGKNRHACREYSLASGEQENHLDIIYRLIPHGALTPELITLKAGETIDISGPTGTFTLRDPTRPIVFIATGTGIAPCRSYFRTHPNLNLTLIHGVRNEEDLYFQNEWDSSNYKPCLSTPDTISKKYFHGRLTALLATYPLPDQAQFYLCGANEMIYEVQTQLKERKILAKNIFHEPYYYRWENEHAI